MNPRLRPALFVLVSCWLWGAQPASALDKQGSAHGGSVASEGEGFDLTGSLLAGAAVYNPAYAARPDNSGLAFGRIAPHFDVDLIGSRLSLPIDINLFSDRLRAAFDKFVPSELDVIGGATSTWPLGPTALEAGLRYERDMPIDRGGLTQSYVDARVRLLYSLTALAPHATDWLHGGDLSGYFTLGWFGYNPTYAARPNNSGRALLRYGAHAGVSALDDHLLVSLDGVMFTDRRKNALAPSELDATFDVGGRFEPLELHVAYERDMPVDQRSLVQHFVLVYLSFGFELIPNSAQHAAAPIPNEIDPDGCDLSLR